MALAVGHLLSMKLASQLLARQTPGRCQNWIGIAYAVDCAFFQEFE
jgi:hypothetical protein